MISDNPKHRELIEAVSAARAAYRASDYWNANCEFEQQVKQGNARMQLDFAVREAEARLHKYESALLAKVKP